MVPLSSARWLHWHQPWYTEIVPEGCHLFIPCNDSTTQDLLPDLARICDFVQSHRVAGSFVLVHCDKGVSRSSTAMIAHLMRTHQWSPSAALALVGGKRRIRPIDNFKEQLQVWDTVGAFAVLVGASAPAPRSRYQLLLRLPPAQLEARARPRPPASDWPLQHPFCYLCSGTPC